MPKPSAIITTAAALMNDAEQSVYTNVAVLPYLNLAFNVLQEIFELNNIPVVNKTSTSILIKAGNNKIGFDTTPALPSSLIEIQQLWESQAGQNQWVPMFKQEFISHYLQDNTSINQFLIWAWKEQAIELIAANADNDIKIDYIGSIFNTPILIGNINVNIPIVNIQTFLEFETAALCAIFMAENESRYTVLTGMAGEALGRALGIPIKGMQEILTRRRPFRASFKRRGLLY